MQVAPAVFHGTETKSSGYTACGANPSSSNNYQDRNLKELSLNFEYSRDRVA